MTLISENSLDNTEGDVYSMTTISLDNTEGSVYSMIMISESYPEGNKNTTCNILGTIVQNPQWIGLHANLLANLATK